MAETETHKLLITPAATRDLEQIWLYSQDMWSTEQALAYIDSLNQQFLGLCSLPEMGRQYPYFAADIRLFVSTPHIIIYKITAEGIQIQRVLSGQQNWPAIVQQLD